MQTMQRQPLSRTNVSEIGMRLTTAIKDKYGYDVEKTLVCEDQHDVTDVGLRFRYNAKRTVAILLRDHTRDSFHVWFCLSGDNKRQVIIVGQLAEQMRTFDAEKLLHALMLRSKEESTESVYVALKFRLDELEDRIATCIVTLAQKVDLFSE